MIRLAIATGCACLLAVVATGVAAWGVWSTVLEPIDQQILTLRTYRPPTTVEVFDRNGVLFDRYTAEQRREWVELGSLPPIVAEAFVAAEDRRFYSHPGVDVWAIVRATVANVRAGRVVEGGSTLSQQVVKNLVVGRERTVGRKVREAAGALLLERRLSKDEILELYLNLVYLGSGSYGVQAAAQRTFDLDAADLGPAEAALLASLVPAPSAYAPQADPAGAVVRRDRVLRAMRDVGSLDDAGLEAALATPLSLGSARQGPSPTGDAFRTMVRREVRRLLGDERASHLGLEVHTGFDPDVQAIAERAVRGAVDAVDARWRYSSRGTHVPKAPGEPFCEGAAVVLDHTTGEVVALVGGYSDHLEGFVRAVQGLRQPGSAFKPIVYAAALDAGWRASDLVEDSPLSLLTDQGWWTPDNHDGEYLGPITLRTALAISSNTAAVRLAQDVGMDRVVAMAHRLGIETELRSDLSVALGSSEITPMDLARVYATIARGGRTVEPVYIQRLVADGRVLATAGEALDLVDLQVQLPGGDGQATLDPAIASEMTKMLTGTIAHGTGWPARRPNQDRAGKTGTTSEARDVWFAGFTPRHTIVVWIGTDAHDPLGRGETGATGALPAWAEIADGLGMPGIGEPPERFTPAVRVAGDDGRPRSREVVAVAVDSL